MICQECGFDVPENNTYHPWLHCVIYNAYGQDPNHVLATYRYIRPREVVAHLGQLQIVRV